MMQGKTVVLILVSVALSAVGQLFLMSGAQRLTGLGRLEFLFGASRDVLVPLASVYLFGEQLRRLHVIGIVLIVVGVAFLLSGY